MASSNLLKGALIYHGVPDDFATPVVFQFNPASLNRLQVNVERDDTISEAIRFTLVFNAYEGIDQGEAGVTENGIYPRLAALEELLEQQTVLQQQTSGWFDWLFPQRTVGFLAFVYGERVIPVKIKRMNIKELIHNGQLVPLHASVDVHLRVLTTEELTRNTEGLMALALYKQYRHRKALLMVE